MWRDKYDEIRLITYHWQQVLIRPGLFYHNSIEFAKHDPRRWFFCKQMTHKFIEERKKCLKLFLRIYIAGLELLSASSGKLQHFIYRSV